MSISGSAYADSHDDEPVKHPRGKTWVSVSSVRDSALPMESEAVATEDEVGRRIKRVRREAEPETEVEVGVGGGGPCDRCQAKELGCVWPLAGGKKTDVPDLR